MRDILAVIRFAIIIIISSEINNQKIMYTYLLFAGLPDKKFMDWYIIYTSL